ncbi:porphobilinogen synthase [Peptococcus simiae]|uniref:Delta-aminolevulinic acid dehydratase n=1 Tax=Peptococcus simiae TaxID=1643805 RepID=A0ABW9GXQ4_9FIRM
MKLTHRMRRLRRTPAIRRMVQNVYIHPEDMIYPIFVTELADQPQEVSSMPGVYQFPLDHVLSEVDRCVKAGVEAIMLFGLPAEKDPQGSQAYAEDGIVQEAIRKIRAAYPDLIISTDVCLCEYTSHGHCGMITAEGQVQNDVTLDLLAKTAVSHARAGADILSPSDMMDGRVGVIRQALDDAGFEHVSIMAHCAKFASAFYGPFRDAADSAPQFGDRKSYQMDPASGTRQALQEIALDVDEGTDFIIIKPALAYLDLVNQAAENFLQPIVTYNVSGEYAMVKAAAQQGWIDEKKVVMEMMKAFKRAGADIIITYHAIDVATWLKEGQQ